MATVTPTVTPRPIVIDPARAAESNVALFLTIICVFFSLALSAALLRFYSRILVRSFGRDDVFMVFAMVYTHPFHPSSSSDTLKE